jgi:tellurite methyltransferase
MLRSPTVSSHRHPVEGPRERWNRRYAEREAPQAPSRFLVDRAPVLPASGRALDVAGGAGRNALWLARRGLDVTLVDVSDAACDLALERASEAGLPLDVLRLDLDAEPLPVGPWDVVLLHHYLDRRIVRAAPELLAPGGLLLLCQPTVRNLERHPRPTRRWLLDEGELAELVADLPAVEVVELDEGWTEEDRHEAGLVLRRRDERALS